MSTPSERRQLPTWAYLEAESVQRYTQSTLKGHYGLLPFEIFWAQRHKALLDAGYVLRARYQPRWQPSWLGTNLRPSLCEDSVSLTNFQLIDARRSDNNDLVAIKRFPRSSPEIYIAQYLCSLRDDPRNHTVPVLSIMNDPFDDELALMVMPYLRPCTDPPFFMLGEVVEFVNQTLEGLVFMHEHHIAHRDIAVENIMMDADALYPGGYHPVRRDCSPDGVYEISPLARIDHSVRYYFIDFGLACHLPPGSPSLVFGDVGRDSEVPELSSSIPYDAFKMDIFALGNLYAKEFTEKYNHLQFLEPLIEPMTQEVPGSRPRAEEVLTQWQDIRNSLSEKTYRWRLTPKSAPVGRVIHETVAVAWEGISNLKKYMT